MQLIGLMGLKGSGKDAIATKLKELSIETGDRSVHILKMADGLKRIVREYYDLGEDIYEDRYQKERTLKEVSSDRIKNDKDTVRDLMIFLGQSLKDYYPSIWVNNLNKNIDEIKHKDPFATIIVTDIRFPDEMEYIKNKGGCMIMIERSENYPNAKLVTRLLGVNFISRFIISLFEPSVAVKSEWHSFKSQNMMDYSIYNEETIEEAVEALLLCIFKFSEKQYYNHAPAPFPLD
jgi:hypothetical protein